jgi:hypothetical protein
VGVTELGMITALWAVMIWIDPAFVATVYLPAFVTGLGLCHLQGYFEHARGTTSHYGRIYNLLFFNDGYHVEHHQRSSVHWTTLPLHNRGGASHSRWPPVLRWLDAINLETLERVVLRSTWLQRYVVASHARAFRALLRDMPDIRRATIVGGGLFPRTALVLQKLLPAASLTIVDASARNIEIARPFLNGTIPLCHHTYQGELDTADLVVIPLAFIGDRDRLYRDPPAPRVIVHDWIWRRTARSVVVSWFLLKRVNLITQ